MTKEDIITLAKEHLTPKFRGTLEECAAWIKNNPQEAPFIIGNPSINNKEHENIHQNM